MKDMGWLRGVACRQVSARPWAFLLGRILLLLLGLGSLGAEAGVAMRRPISPKQPMWLIHIDTWNYADPEKIIALIPEDVRPYVVMNISISISHNTTTNRFTVAEYGYEVARSWVRACAEHRMWCVVQQSSGGMHQFSETDLSIYEDFFLSYPNFLGFNYAEAFWGFDDATDPVSAGWSARMTHLAKLIEMSNEYGGYVILSWCGNPWSPNINPIAMLKRNAAFELACRNNAKNLILCEKHTTESYKSDMESLCLGAYLSGYSGQYGIRYDSTGWTDASGGKTNFTLVSGAAPQLEHMLLNGETVVDGPELIWQQCFKEVSEAGTDGGYTMRRWQTFPQFDNVSVDLFRKVLDGTVRVPSRREVIDRTRVVVVNTLSSGTIDQQYSSPETLFEGLYRPDSEGNYALDKSFFKKTGRYPTVPTVYQLNDDDAKSFQVQVDRAAYATRWPTIASKVAEFDSLFPAEYTGTLYAGRFENAWVTYNPFKTGETAAAIIPLRYNTCEHLELSYSQYTTGIVKEYAKQLTFYLCNYDPVINTGLKTDTITLYGATSEPTWSYQDRGSHQASILSKTWSGGVFVLTVQHNGALDITVNASGAASGRLSSYTTATVVEPAAPPSYMGPRQHEAECFDYKNVAAVIKSGSAGAVRNYTGQGYLQFGSSAKAAARTTITVPKAGSYRLETRYAVTEGSVSTVDLYVNKVKVATPVFAPTSTLSDWAVDRREIVLTAGSNTLEFCASATAAGSLYLDNIVLYPTTTDSRLSNLSARTFVGTGDGLQIAGFVISGTQEKPVLLRACGPALASLSSLQGLLAEPVLQLYQGAGSLATNTVWGTAANAQAVQTTAASVGAFAWPTTSKDSALLQTLKPGAYTALVSGKDGGTGIAMVEVYDADFSTASRLSNLSTRAQVKTGDSIQIAGFVISGNSPKRVLIRASGPALSTISSLTGLLPDPSLQLYKGSRQVFANTGWATASNPAEIQATAARLGAFAWPAGSQDSALLVTLPPGVYTALVSGASGDSGIVLLEVYDAD